MDGSVLYHIKKLNKEQTSSKLYGKSYRYTIKGIARDILANSRDRAKRYNLENNLSFDNIVKRLRKGYCEVTGIRFNFTKEKKRYSFAPSLDRKDHTKG